MKEKISQFSKNLMDKFLGFLSETGNKNEKVNIIIISIELLISLVLYCLFVLYIVEFKIDLGETEDILESTIGLMFAMVKTNNGTLGNIVTLLLINFPAVLLFNGIYCIKNFHKEQISKKMILSGILTILLSLAIVCFTFVTKNQMLIYCSIVTYISTLVMIFYFLVIKKIDYFSVRQLIFLYFSVIVFIILFIILLIIIAIIIISIVIIFLLSAMQGEGSTSKKPIQKRKIKRDKDFPDRGVLVDKNGTPLTDDSGRVIEVKDINEQNLTATINGEKIDLEGNKK